MNIVQAVFGVFHHFELARELHRRGHLETIYSTWPWARLKREGLPHSKVRTFPWLHTPETILSRTGLWPRRLSDELGLANALAFDNWTARRLPIDADALIALAGAGLKTGRLLQQRGGRFICDRGSTHPRFQEQIIAEEYRLWNVALPISDIRDTLREEEIYATADAITVPSTFALRTYLPFGVPVEKLVQIPYGVRLEAFSPLEDISHSSDHQFNVVFAGALSLRKGLPYLLQAFAQLRHPHKRLRLIGSLEPCLKQVLHRLPLDRVELLGPLPRTALVDHMRHSHALVLPSIEDGFGLVLTEAMACGCPVIATTNTGAEDLLTPAPAGGYNEGFITPIRDPAALTAALQTLADSPQTHQAMRSAALVRVHTLGGWSDYGDRWESLLRQLLAAR